MAVTNVYATASDVQALINALGSLATLTLGVASTPTLAQTESWLDQVAADVDSALLAQRYRLPTAADTTDVLMIKRFVAQKAATIVYHAGFMFDEVPDKIQQWTDEYDNFITRIESGKLRLINQSPRGAVGTMIPTRYRED